MRHIAYTSTAQTWMDAAMAAAFTRNIPYVGGLSRVAHSMCRQYVMTS